MELEKVNAPWTFEQVAKLNEAQFEYAHRIHPFTCGKHHYLESHPVLVATRDGWVCPIETCLYTQNWAWSFQLEAADTFRAHSPFTELVAIWQPEGESGWLGFEIDHDTFGGLIEAELDGWDEETVEGLIGTIRIERKPKGWAAALPEHEGW